MHPDNGLYDAACDLVAAAQRVDRAVRREGVEPTIAATLGCLHSTLIALTSACAALSSNDPPGRNKKVFHNDLSRRQQRIEQARTSRAVWISG
jgi:hypothetical protein